MKSLWTALPPACDILRYLESRECDRFCALRATGRGTKTPSAPGLIGPDEGVEVRGFILPGKVRTVMCPDGGRGFGSTFYSSLFVELLIKSATRDAVTYFLAQGRVSQPLRPLYYYYYYYYCIDDLLMKIGQYAWKKRKKLWLFT